MKTIKLTQNQVAVVDDWRYEELNCWIWFARWDPHTKSFYAVRKEGWPQRTIQMHRQIMNTPDGVLCDHINHNTLDNQEHNLRNATNSQNQMNGRVRSNNKLGQKCVSPHPTGYLVRVMKDGKRVFSKTFGTLGEAIAARDDALEQFHGEYSYRGE